ncbi:MAG: TRAP transporter fused permease subunit [Pseudomonadales bacterium]|nr:TRAP transporter fused permease subunit [Pseudomonadales bacterium]
MVADRSGVMTADRIRTRLLQTVALFVALIHLYLNTFGTLSELRFAAIHFSSFGLLAALGFPLLTDSVRGGYFALAVDLFAGLMAVGCGLYLVLFEADLYQRGTEFNNWDWLVSGAAVLLAIEFCRRCSGWIIPVLVLIALSYSMLWGSWLDNVFSFPGVSVETMLFRSFFGGEGVLGSITIISASYVYPFILFGAFLLVSGAGDFLIDLARCLAGRMVGGPGLVAVFGSGLMGSVSGSAVANTASTGVITIPMMKRYGFTPRFAAGVEAAASTGGQLMPPVMGAGAFVMASYTQIPYMTIVAVSVLPALLYFLSVGFYVRIEAKRLGLTVLDEESVSVVNVLRQGWHYLIPLMTLVAMLIYGFSASFSAVISILAVVSASWLSSRPMGIQGIRQALVEGTQNMIPTAALLIAIGLIVNVVTTTGFGNTFSLMVVEWSGGSLLIAISLIAVASLILGAGLPVTASYIVIATLCAPLLFELMTRQQLIEAIASGGLSEDVKGMLSIFSGALGYDLNHELSLSEAERLLAEIPADFLSLIREQVIDPVSISLILLSAHLIIFWLSQDSNVTPPVCMCAFSAAAIAGSRPMATGFTAWKMAKGLYLIPLLFAYSPLVTGTLLEKSMVFVVAAIGLYAMAAVFQGYMRSALSIWLRVVLALAILIMLWPHGNVWLTGLGVITTAVIYLVSGRGRDGNNTVNE